jgi:hypothetical protein
MSKNLTYPPTMWAHDTFNGSVTQGHRLGTYGETNDGRGFRYGLVGVVPTVAGSVYQSDQQVVQHLSNTPPVVNVGDTSFIYTPGVAAGAANLYAEGYLQVDTAPGNGYLYQVSGHGPITASVPFTLNLVDPIQVALTTASRVGLRQHPYKGVIVCPVALTAKVVGVPVSVIPAGQYGWLQTRGMASVLTNGSPNVGTAVTNSASVIGGVDAITTTNLVTSAAIGYMQQPGVSTKNCLVDLILH